MRSLTVTHFPKTHQSPLKFIGMFNFEQTAPKAAIYPKLGGAAIARCISKDILAAFAHQLRQPLSALEALTFYLGLITGPEDARVHEQLQRMHSEIADADQILREGMRVLLDHFLIPH